MKKVLVILAVMAFAFAGLTFATSSRINGLGVPTWMTLDDDAIVFSYVGQLNTFKNLALLEKGEYLLFVAYSLGSLILGIIFVFVGLMSSKIFS